MIQEDLETTKKELILLKQKGVKNSSFVDNPPNY